MYSKHTDTETKRPIHEVNYCIAISICDKCPDDGSCSDCLPVHTFSGLGGQNDIENFCKWAFDHPVNEEGVHNKLIHQHAPKISPSELSLPRETRRTLAQLRTNKSPILISYLHKVDETHHPSPLCPLCKTHPHTTDHLFNCTHLYTSSNILDLWMSPERVAPLLVRWKRRLAWLL